MSERIFRFITGFLLCLALTLALLLESNIPMYLVLSMIAFEGVTNLRIPILINRIRFGRDSLDKEKSKSDCDIVNMGFMKKLEAERILRFVVIVFVSIPYFLHLQFDQYFLDFIPWFVAFMLCLAGITNICPMVMFLRFTGMR